MLFFLLSEILEHRTRILRNPRVLKIAASASIVEAFFEALVITLLIHAWLFPTAWPYFNK